MKKKLLIVLGFISVIMTLASCDNDDNSLYRVEKNESGEIAPVRCGIIIEGYARQKVDESDPVSVFFGKELHSPYWDGFGNEFKTFFEQGEWNDESCLMINSQQEFQAAYMGTKELPEVDFNQYTLVIGRTWSSDGSYVLDKTVLYNRDFTYELEAQFLHYLNGTAICSIIRFYYWSLYPKLEPKEIILKRTVTDVYNLPES